MSFSTNRQKGIAQAAKDVYKNYEAEAKQHGDILRIKWSDGSKFGAHFIIIDSESNCIFFAHDSHQAVYSYDSFYPVELKDIMEEGLTSFVDRCTAGDKNEWDCEIAEERLRVISNVDNPTQAIKQCVDEMSVAIFSQEDWVTYLAEDLDDQIAEALFDGQQDDLYEIGMDIAEARIEEWAALNLSLRQLMKNGILQLEAEEEEEELEEIQLSQ